MSFLKPSEFRVMCLAIAGATASYFVSRKLLIPLLLLWSIISRLVARGARNRCRPISCADSERDKQRAKFVMYEDMPTEDRPVAVVTGTNSGIGYHTAVGLAAEGYVVVVTCRSQALTQQTGERIRMEAQRQRQGNPERYCNAPSRVVVVGFMPLECDDFESVRTFASWFTTSFRDYNFQVLVNNAGCMRVGVDYSKFNPQLEFHTAVNFLGPLLLTELLLPLLEKNGGRVVYVSSAAHKAPGRIPKSDGASSESKHTGAYGWVGGQLLSALKRANQGKEGSDGPLVGDSIPKVFLRYGTTKLLNTYHAHVIARRYRNVSDPKRRVFACSLHPGIIKSGFSHGLGLSKVLNLIFSVVACFVFKTSEEGAQTTLHCAMCPLDELELVAAPPAKRKDGEEGEDGAVSPYFLECSNQTRSMLADVAWDAKEAEMIVEWGKELVGFFPFEVDSFSTMESSTNHELTR